MVAVVEPTPIFGAFQAASNKYMLEDLARSGLTPDDILVEVCRNPPAKDSRAGYVIPYFHHLDATPITPRRVKVDYEAKPSKERKKQAKYLSLKIETVGDPILATTPYIPPSFWKLGGDTVYILEGEKKAVCFSKYGAVPAMAIAGCGNWSYTPPGGSKIIHPHILEAAAKRGLPNIVIVPDPDYTRPSIGREYGMFARMLIKAGHNVGFLDTSNLKDEFGNPAKPDDYIPKYGFNKFLAEAPWKDPNDLGYDRRELIQEYNLHTEGQNESIVLNESNVVKLLEGHPAFKGLFWYDSDKSTVYMGDTQYDRDNHAVSILITLQDKFGLTKLKRPTVDGSIIQVAKEYHARHFQREYYDELVAQYGPDKELLETWMMQCCGVVDTPFAREVSCKLQVAPVARVYEPGCPLDYCIVLKGPQGIGKSGMVKVLWPGNSGELLPGNSGKDLYMVCNMYSVVEVPEFRAFSYMDLAAQKALITTRADPYRKPYDRVPMDHPRRFIFLATTNDSKFLKKDSSGQRRFPVLEMAGPINFELLKELQPRIVAAAVCQYREWEGTQEISNIRGATEEAVKYEIDDLQQDRLEEVVNKVAHGLMNAKWRPLIQSKLEALGGNGDEWYEWFQTSELIDAVDSKMPSMRFSHQQKSVAIANAIHTLGWIKVKNLSVKLWDVDANDKKGGMISVKKDVWARAVSNPAEYYAPVKM